MKPLRVGASWNKPWGRFIRIGEKYYNMYENKDRKGKNPPDEYIVFGKEDQETQGFNTA